MNTFDPVVEDEQEEAAREQANQIENETPKNPHKLGVTAKKIEALNEVIGKIGNSKEDRYKEKKEVRKRVLELMEEEAIERKRFRSDMLTSRTEKCKLLRELFGKKGSNEEEKN